MTWFEKNKPKLSRNILHCHIYIYIYISPLSFFFLLYWPISVSKLQLSTMKWSMQWLTNGPHHSRPLTANDCPTLLERYAIIGPTYTTTIMCFHACPSPSFKRHQLHSCVTVRHEWINVSTPRMTFHSFVNEQICRLRTSSIIFIRNWNVSTAPLWITKSETNVTGTWVPME